MKSFKLTPEQENLLFGELTKAEPNNGVVFAQIGHNEAGDIICHAQYIDQYWALKIKALIDKSNGGTPRMCDICGKKIVDCGGCTT